MNVFLDTSALAKRYIDEDGSDEVEEICRKADQLVLCVICQPEVISGLRRLRREDNITAKQYNIAKQALFRDVKDAYVCDLTVAVIMKSVDLLENNSLRAMDALHVAAAVEWGVDAFVSGDQRQLKALESKKPRTVDVSSKER